VKKDNGYTIYYLLKHIKDSDPKTHKEVSGDIALIKFFKSNKLQYFPENECYIEKKWSSEKSHNFLLADYHCPIHGDEHSEDGGKRFFEVESGGYACMKCTNIQCLNKRCPEEGILVPKNTMKIVFMQQNNYITNNNNFGSNYFFDITKIIDSKLKIFDEDDLNEFVINSLSEDNDDIAQAISHLNKEKVCVVDNVWYTFNGVHWMEAENIVDDMLSAFVLHYNKIDKYIMSMDSICGNEREECRIFLKNISKNIKNDQKNRGIIKALTKKLSKKMFVRFKYELVRIL
jgi:hypothetical protein